MRLRTLLSALAVCCLLVPAGVAAAPAGRTQAAPATVTPSVGTPATAGATNATAGATNATAGATNATAGATNATGAAAASPPVGHAGPAKNSTIGYFGGYWYDSTIHVNQSNGLNASEARAYVRRTMARDEMIRHHNYEHAVPVDVLPRAQYAANQSSGSVNASYAAWNQQVWEAPLIIGARTNLSAAMRSYYSGNVLGFYSPAHGDIRIIVPSDKHAAIGHATLAHELTHALQDQYYNLSARKYNPGTQDGQLGTKGLIEGEARYVETVYQQHCKNGSWSCVADAKQPSASAGSSSGSSSSANDRSASPPESLQLTLYFPYASGPGYVHDLLQKGGWDAVNAAWRSPPNATTTVIHDHAPPSGSVHLDRGAATGGWKTYPNQGENGTDTLGEASMFVGLWWQSQHYGANAVPSRAIKGNGNYRTYQFKAAATTGWVDDKVLPYHRGSERGFVWKSTWNTSDDASQFAGAYVSALKAHNATKRNGTWVVSGLSSTGSTRDGYQGAYRVVRSNDTVTVVKAPNVTAVNELRPSLGGSASATASGGSGGSSPGFGVVAAVAALLGATLAAGRR